LGLTPKVAAAVPLMESTLLSHLATLGFTKARVATRCIDSLIPDAYKRGVTLEQ
ncbi:MAG: hydrogenase expression/formation protein, partial [Shewanella sp.]